MRSLALAKSTSSGRGYTAVEVLVAMTLFGIGAAGVISMQAGAVKGDADARQMDVATQLTREWMERLRRDGQAWTLPSPSNAATTGAGTLANTKFLSNVGKGWVLPTLPATQPAEGISPAFDILGRDMSAAEAACTQQSPLTAVPSCIVYCTNIRITAMDTATPPQSLMAEVRLFWPRSMSPIPQAGPGLPTNWCTGGPSIADPANATAYSGGVAPLNPYFHYVYAASVVRENTAP
jgi:prepilin-type N-terminal cleavage/methylation domain-containing protein